MTTRVLGPLLLPKRLLKQTFKAPSLSTTNFTRRFSDDNSGSKESNTATDFVRSVEWRKARLDQLERKFANKETDMVRSIQTDTELQPEWKSMESRVTNRRSLTKEETGGKTGRSNIRQTEEDVWLESGLYNMNDNETNEKEK